MSQNIKINGNLIQTAGNTNPSELNSVKNDVTGIKESLTHQADVGFLEKNLCNPSAFESGYININDGKTYTTNSKWLRNTEYIELKSNTIVVSASTENVEFRVYYYDSSKNFISTERKAKGSTFTLPTNAVYIRHAITNDEDITVSAISTIKPQIEYGTVAHSFTPYALGNTDLTKLRDKDINQYFKGANLLNPSLQTSTINGVTCTKNADGTFTVNGTASSTAVFILNTYSLESGTYKLCGCPSNGTVNSYYMDWRADDNIQLVDSGNGSAYTSSGQSGKQVRIIISSGYTANNLVFKPMMTKYTNLGYNDFVPYEDSSNRVLKESLANQEDYSLNNEIVIGKDQNGKTIYRKIVSYTTTTDATNTGITINAYRIYRLSGSVAQTNGQIISAPYYYADTNKVLYYFANNNLFINGVGSAVTNATHTIVIEYSKP